MDNDGLVELDAATAVENDCLCAWYMAVKAGLNIRGYKGLIKGLYKAP